MTRARPQAAVESPELASIRAQLRHLEYVDTLNAVIRLRLQQRRAALLEETEGCYASHGSSIR